MKIRVLTLVLLFTTLLIRAEDRTQSSAQCEIQISGTAQGGELVLIFPGVPFKLREVKVTTAAGEDSKKVVEKLYDAYIEKTTLTSGSKTNTILRVGFGSLSNGDVAMHSTDPGIFSVPAVTNLKSEITENKNIKLTWAIPNNVTYDSIYVGGTLGLVGTLAKNSTSITITLPDNFEPVAKAKTFEFRIIGQTSGTPSDLATISVQNPKYVP